MKLSDATDLLHAEASATGVYYAGQKVWPVVPDVGIEPKDWKASNSAASFSTITVDLPDTSADGDYCVIGVSSGQPATAPTGWTTICNEQRTDGFPGLNYAVFTKVLNSADVAASSVSIALSHGESFAAIAMIWEADAIDGVDVYSSPVTDTSIRNAPLSITADGVTTTADGDQLLGFFASYLPPGGNAEFSATTGWTAVASYRTPTDTTRGAVFVYRAQTSAGATGDVSAVDNTSGDVVTQTGAILIALKRSPPAVPAIVIAFDLPDPTVGEAYTGSVTAENVDGATGAITITADTLPDGLTPGTVVDNGDDSYTLPITGTPTTAETVDSTFSAINGTQSATLEHEFVVSEPSSGPALVQDNIISIEPMYPLPSGGFAVNLGATATAGNLLVAAFQGYNYQTVATPAGWTLKGEQAPYAGGCGVRVFSKISDGTETGAAFSPTANNFRGCVISVSEYSGAAAGSFSGNANFGTWNSTTYGVGPTDAPVDAASIPLMFVPAYTPDASLAVSSPWTGAFVGGNKTRMGSCAGKFTRSAPGAATSMTITRAGTASTYICWANIWIDPA